MRELTVMELDQVSGASFASRTGAAVLGGIAGLVQGVYKGAVTGGSSGGLLGLGILSAGVGFIVGGIAGVVSGAAYGFVNDWAATVPVFNNATGSLLDPTLNPPKV